MKYLNFQISANETCGKAESAPEFQIAAKTCILMVGMSLTKTRGGISTLIGEILRSDLKDDFAIEYIESQAEDFKGFDKLILAIKAVFIFFGKVLTKKPKLVYVHIGSNASLYRESFFIVLAKIFRKKTIAHFHAGDVEEYLEKQSAIGKKFISCAIGLSDGLIAVSKDSAQKLRTLAPKNEIEIIANVIDTTPFAFPVNRFDVRKKAVRVLFVGAMGKLKGETDLADAVKLIAEKHPNLRVSFLGFGGENLQEYCRRIGIENLIEFVGAVSLEERLGFFEKADIFALPTYAEAMPISVIEAMAAGLPVVSTTVGGIPELIEDDGDGFLFTPGDSAALAEKISILASNKDLRIRIGQKARQKVYEQMNFSQYTNKLRNHLLSAI